MVSPRESKSAVREWSNKMNETSVRLTQMHISLGRLMRAGLSATLRHSELKLTLLSASALRRMIQVNGNKRIYRDERKSMIS